MSASAAKKEKRGAVRSMTGFARVSGRISDALGFTLSLKSVNHRFLDPHLRLPGGMDALEMQLRRLLKERLVRGHVEVTLNVDRGAKNDTGYDAELVAAYLAAFRSAAALHGLTCQPDLNAVLSMPGVFGGNGRGSSSERGSEEEVQAIEAAVLREIGPLVDSLNEMREHEGALLAKELNAALERLRKLVDEASELREGVQQAYFERISQRIAAMLGGDSFDRDRVLQEAALLVERSDVEEEAARLRAHIDHFRTMLEGGGEVGKKLDFLMQEMNREANTLLSKTGGIAGSAQRITELGLNMKSEIEKIREQVQNLE